MTKHRTETFPASRIATIGNKVEIREILPMTILLDHDVMDGAPMARFINELIRNIDRGMNL